MNDYRERPSEEEYISDGYVQDIEDRAVYEYKVNLILEMVEGWNDHSIKQLINKLKTKLD